MKSVFGKRACPPKGAAGDPRQDLEGLRRARRRRLGDAWVSESSPNRRRRLGDAWVSESSLRTPGGQEEFNAAPFSTLCFGAGRAGK